MGYLWNFPSKFDFCHYLDSPSRYACFRSISVYILIPSSSNPVYHMLLKVSFSSFSISNFLNNAQNNSNGSVVDDVNKQVLLKNFTLSIADQFMCPKNRDEYKEILGNLKNLDVIINPVVFELKVAIPSIKRLFKSHEKLIDNLPEIILQLSIDNLEVSLLLSHLEMVQDALKTLRDCSTETKEAKYRYLEALRHHPDELDLAEKANSLLKTHVATDSAGIEKSKDHFDNSESKSKSARLSWLPNHFECHFTLSRLAVTLTECKDEYNEHTQDNYISNSPLRFIPDASKKRETYTARVVSVVLYGIKYSYIETIQIEGKFLIGAIKIYGVQNSEILSLGSNLDDWLALVKEMAVSESTDGYHKHKGIILKAAITSSYVISKEIPHESEKKDSLNEKAKHVDGDQPTQRNDPYESDRMESNSDNDSDGDSSEFSIESAQGDVCQSMSSLKCVVDIVQMQLHVETVAYLKQVVVHLLSRIHEDNALNHDTPDISPNKALDDPTESGLSCSLRAWLKYMYYHLRTLFSSLLIL